MSFADKPAMLRRIPQARRISPPDLHRRLAEQHPIRRLLLAPQRIALPSGAVPDAVVLSVAPDAALPPDHPAHGKTQVRGLPTAYVCPGQTCRLPVTDPLELADALRSENLRATA